MYMNLIEVCSTQSCFTVTYQKNHERGVHIIHQCVLYTSNYGSFLHSNVFCFPSHCNRH